MVSVDIRVDLDHRIVNLLIIFHGECKFHILLKIFLSTDINICLETPLDCFGMIISCRVLLAFFQSESIKSTPCLYYVGRLTKLCLC